MSILEKARKKIVPTENKAEKEQMLDEKKTSVCEKKVESFEENAPEIKEKSTSCQEDTPIPEKENLPSVQTISSTEGDRKLVQVTKIGSDHVFANKNNQDFVFNLLNMKVVTDGCSKGKHSEVGPRVFGQLFARKAKEYYDNGECINEDNFTNVVDEIFKQMLNLCSDYLFIRENYCFTILVCFELEDEFVVYSCGDGYIIKENEDGIVFEQLDNGEYPCYYIYNFIEDKTVLIKYQEGVHFKVNRYSKEEYRNVGVASDGLRFYENLVDVEKVKFIDFLHEGKGGKIAALINRNNQRNEMFHDDISICF